MAKTEYIKARNTRAARIDKRVRDMVENCVIINYAHERRSITGQIFGDPTPEHRELVERMRQHGKESEEQDE